MENEIPASGIIIDREGSWSYQGQEISRRDIIRLFYRHLNRDTAGRYFIEIGDQRCQAAVEDTAYVVWSVFWTGKEPPAAERVHLLLSDDSIEELDPDTLRIAGDSVLYCMVKSRHYVARFSRSGYYQLAEHIEHDSPRDAYFIIIAGRRHYIAGV